MPETPPAEPERTGSGSEPPADGPSAGRPDETPSAPAPEAADRAETPPPSAETPPPNATASGDGGRGRGRGVLITVSLIALLVVAAVVVIALVSGDDNDESADDGTTTTSSDGDGDGDDSVDAETQDAIEDVVQGYFEAYDDADCERMLEHISASSYEALGQTREEALADCESEAEAGTFAEDFEVDEVEVSSVEGDIAEVEITSSSDGGTESGMIPMVRENGEWKLDAGATAE